MKLQIMVSDELCEKVDKYAKEIGVSRSALCAMFIGQGVRGYDQASEIIDELKTKILDNPELLSKVL